MDKGALLLHGFGASRWEMETLENYLKNHEFEVHNTRMAGHETSIEDFSKTTWQQWYESAQDVYLKIKTPKKYAIGFSTGGAITALLAQNHKPDALVTINAPVWLKDKRAKLAGIAKHFMEAVDIELAEEEKGHRYEKRPVTAIEQLNKLIKIYKGGLHKIEAPTLIIQSTRDPTVEPKSAQYLWDNIQTKDKQIVWYASNEHVITRNHEKSIFPYILEFLQRQ